MELGALVRSGELGARELVAAALERIEALEGRVNAFTLVDAEGALAAADGIGPGDGRPFAGVPIAIKDVATPVAGMPLSECSGLFGDRVSDHDAHAVRRLRRAGLVIVGRTNAPELGIQPVTEPRRFGPTLNPWDPERTPGGSSGGSAAAVAAGMVPLAHGNDGGGSIRTPAACCGLVGLKPSRGRISRGPDLGDSLLLTDGVLTRTVAETAAVLDVLAGYETGDATWAPPAPEPFAETARREPGALRIGLTAVPQLVETEVDAACAAAVGDAAELLASLGHDVQEIEPPWTPGELWPVFADLWAAGIAAGVSAGGMLAGREPRPDDVEPLTWALYERGKAIDAPRSFIALAAIQAYARRIVELCSGYDALLMPSLAKRPVRIGELADADPMTQFESGAAFNPFSPLWNVTGQPAISLPLFHGDDGLPLAVQLAGPPLGDGLLLSLAAQLEAARPWADRRPPLAGGPD